MSEEFNEDRLGRLVALAKGSEGNEQKTAIRFVKNLCKKFKLDFDEVMEGIKTKEFTIKYKNSEEKRILVQIICRYGHLNIDGSTYNNPFAKHVRFTSTQEKYMEVMNAWSVLGPLYKKEREKMKDVIFHGFLNKHKLFYMPTAEEYIKMRKKDQPFLSLKEQKERAMGAKLAEDMEDAEIHKQLNKGS